MNAAIAPPVAPYLIKSITEALLPRLRDIRRHLHAHPELSGQETETAAYVAGVMSSIGCPVREGVGRTGLVADLAGTGADPRRLAIRADMDALPIQEETLLAYSSLRPGVCHACGHDIHTTVALGTAMVLAEVRKTLPGEALPGDVRFLFQPAEEVAQGARWMVADGAMEGVSAILGLHVFPTIAGGSVGVRYGALTAAADDLELIIRGESGHGARPHEAVDAIWLAAQVVTTLQQAIARTHNPLRPVVLTIGQIQGGRAPNVIADRVRLVGTVRSLHPDTTADLPQWIDNIVGGICRSHGARYELNYRPGVPSVHNHDALTRLLETSARTALGDRAVEVLAEPSLGAEDFSIYLKECPGSMFRLGVGWSDRPNYPLHHPKFEANEAAIAAGVITLASAAVRYWHTPELKPPLAEA